MLKITRILQLLFPLVILRDVLASSQARCEAPQSPEHGSVTLLGEIKVGALATYSCEPGRRLVGATTTKCLMTGQWTFGAPQCLNSCKVPVTENGKMLRILIRRWRFQQESVEVLPGEEINSNETLLLRCVDDFMPTENSKFSENIQLEVTCIDGKWSKDFACRKASCTGEPPAAANATPVISSRKHGHRISYRCDKNLMQVHGYVKCHFGSWIGEIPKCLNYPCLTRSLIYPALVKPAQEYLESNESFEIICEHGFRRQRGMNKITCNLGRWDINQNPCTEDNGRDTIILTAQPVPAWTPPTVTAPYSVYVTPPNPHTPDTESSRECFCTYDYENYFMKAQLRGKILKRGDKIMRGETVSFECKFVSRVLSWKNGLRFFGKVTMMCNTCKKWQGKDLPTCNPAERNQTVIGSDEDLKVLPGGTVEIQEGDRRRFFCSSTVTQPHWYYEGKLGVAVNKTEVLEDANVMYVSYLEITKVEKKHRGRYECLTIPGRVDYDEPAFLDPAESAFLDLRITGFPVINCPFFALGNGLIVSYSHSNKISSLASFSCPVNAKLVGNSTAECKNDGTWTSIQPHCESEDYASCPRFPPSSGLDVKYSKNLSVGSVAIFKCSSPSRNLIGSDFSICQNDRRWSNPSPSCSDPVCSIGDLSSSIPETVEPDMTGVDGEFVPTGSEMRLKCSDGSILQGNAMVLCEDGKWKLGSRYECVPGCVLNIDPSSHLLIQPVQDIYKFGDFVLLSCPRGKQMSEGVERLLCLGNTWSNSLPFCKDSKKRYRP